MKPEELYEFIRNYCVHDWIMWTALEEAKVHGFNIIYFTITTEPPVCNAYLAVAYDVTRDDIQVLAMLIIIGNTSDLDIDTVTKIAKSVDGVVVALGSYTGVLVPIDVDDKILHIDKIIMRICKELGNKECRAIIDGYYFDIFI